MRSFGSVQWWMQHRNHLRHDDFPGACQSSIAKSTAPSLLQPQTCMQVYRMQGDSHARLESQLLNQTGPIHEQEQNHLGHGAPAKTSTVARAIRLSIFSECTMSLAHHQAHERLRLCCMCVSTALRAPPDCIRSHCASFESVAIPTTTVPL